ncbi:MAG: hypothetical protein ACOZBH_05675 [Patescibacteria group bacterium]
MRPRQRRITINILDTSGIKVGDKVIVTDDGMEVTDSEGDYVISAVFPGAIWADCLSECEEADPEKISDSAEVTGQKLCRHEITGDGSDKLHRISQMEESEEKTDAEGSRIFLVVYPFEEMPLNSKVTLLDWGGKIIAKKDPYGEYVVFDIGESGMLTVTKIPQAERGRTSANNRGGYGFGRRCGPSSQVDFIGPEDIANLRKDHEPKK